LVPVTDNAQSVYELSRIESQPNMRRKLERDFGFKPNFRDAKLELGKGGRRRQHVQGHGETGFDRHGGGGRDHDDFRHHHAAAKCFGHAIENLSLVQPQIIFGLLMGGAVIYWFTGASMQAVVTGAYSAVVFIKANLKFDTETASVADSKKVVEICTVYAQRGLINIFVVVFALRARPAVFKSVFLHRLPDRHRVLWFVPGHFHGQRRRRLGQRQENRRGGFEDRKAHRCTPQRWSATPSAIRSRTRPPWR
jgi:K(+)-stimulated pyrophosphate-energized sodium pump